MKVVTTESKVLPFEGKLGPVPGHALLRHTPDFLTSPITWIAFWTFDDEAGMVVEHLIHWTEFSKWLHRKWPGGGSVKRVICEDGSIIHTTTYTPHHYDEAAWSRAPVLCRSTHQVASLMNRYPLIEVAGVDAWCRSQRRPEDAALIIDPWARDNAAFHARMDQAKAESNSTEAA